MMGHEHGVLSVAWLDVQWDCACGRAVMVYRLHGTLKKKLCADSFFHTAACSFHSFVATQRKRQSAGIAKEYARYQQL